MPAIFIRQLENMQKLMTLVSTPGQREVLLHHARMVLRASGESVREESDRGDVQAAYDVLLAMSSDLWEG